MVLHEAADRSAEILAASAGKRVPEIRQQFDGVIESLSQILGSEFPESADDVGPVLPRRYVVVLRGEIAAALDGAPFTPESRDIVRVFIWLEELLRRSERAPTNRFVARLAGEESVNAVVEIAHDIRSPLTSILFLVDTIRRGHSGKVTTVQERQLGLIYGAALGLSTMSSDLIDAVRGERLVDGQPVPFSVADVLLGVGAIVQPIGEEKGLAFSIEYPAGDARVGYPSALGRVLLNLTSNALRYTDSGSVIIGCTEHSDRVIEFWVKDTGRGIPDSVLAMLFDGFRPTSVGIRFSSAGLGLAICRTLLEAMGSILDVETSEDGTRFSFVLDLPPYTDPA
jgi:signal transduction histidine kinase